MLGLRGSDRRKMDIWTVVLQYAMASSLWLQWLTMFLQKLHTINLHWGSGAVLGSMVAIFGQGFALPTILNAPLAIHTVVMYFSTNPNRSVKPLHLASSPVPYRMSWDKAMLCLLTLHKLLSAIHMAVVSLSTYMDDSSNECILSSPGSH